jgi:hypothetical protein
MLGPRTLPIPLAAAALFAAPVAVAQQMLVIEW